MDNIVAK